MNNTPKIIVGVVALAAIGGVAYAAMNGKGSMAETPAPEVAMEKKDMMAGEEKKMMDDGEKMMKSGMYEAYAPEKLAMAESGDVLLFFHASWCPSCRGLNADIESNRDAIPSDVTILKVDYDTETALKQKYGVTTQHTIVQVRADGTMVKKWSGTPTLAGVVSQIQ